MSNADGYLNILLNQFMLKIVLFKKMRKTLLDFWVTRSHVNLNISMCPPETTEISK